MKKTLVLIFTIILFSCSSDNENANSTESVDLIIGTWTELGQGSVSDDGTDQFSEFNGLCFKLGRFLFERDGTLRIENFDGPDDGCFSTGILTGTWENQGDTYLLRALTDTANNSEAGQEGNIQIEFPTTDRMHWIYQVDSGGIDYEYEVYTRIE